MVCRKKEVVLRLTAFILLLLVIVIHGEEEPAAQSFPTHMWRPRYKRQVGFRRPSASPSDLTPYNQRLDAGEWLAKLLGSLEEPSYGGSSDARTSSQDGQRIFQREARPSQFVQPAAKKRFSLANIRVDPNSLKRQYIYPTPNMALIQLENHVRFPSELNDSRPQRPSISKERKPQRQFGIPRPPSRPTHTGVDSAEESSLPIRRQNTVDVDVYVNYYP